MHNDDVEFPTLETTNHLKNHLGHFSQARAKIRRIWFQLNDNEMPNERTRKHFETFETSRAQLLDTLQEQYGMRRADALKALREIERHLEGVA